MSEGKTTLIWIAVCSILGITFGYFFNAEGVKIVGEIWFSIGVLGGFMIFGSGDVPLEPIFGWLMFGVSLGITVALLHYESWLSPLLR